ncbi:hypothetical protein JCM13210_05560 [Thermaerobacter litoralis]
MPVAVYVVAVVAWLYFVSLDMLATGLPLALAAAGAGGGWIGFLAGWMGLAAMIQRPLLAAWGDRRGHGPLLLLSLAANLAGALLFAAAPHPLTQLVARTLQGTSLAGLVVSSQALMAALAPPARRGRALALQGLADTGGVLAGTNLGEWAWNHLGRTGLFGGTAAVVGLALLVAVAARPWPRLPAGERGPRRRIARAADAALEDPAPPNDAGRPQPAEPPPLGGREAGRWPLPVPFLILGTLTGMIFGAALNLTVLHAQAAGFRAGGWLAVFALVAMAARYATGAIIDRDGHRPAAGGAGGGAAASAGGGATTTATGPGGRIRGLLGSSFGLMAAGETLLALASSPGVAYGAAVVLAAGYGIAHTALVAAAVGGAPASRRGVVAAWLANTIDLGVGAGLAVLGWVLELWGFGGMYGVLAVAGLVGLGLGLGTGRATVRRRAT